MIKIIYQPNDMILTRKQSNIKIYTKNAEYLAFDDEKFDIKVLQNKLF